MAKQLKVLALLLTAVLGVAGCAPAPAEEASSGFVEKAAEEPPAEEKVPGFHLSGEFVAIEEFEAFDNGLDWIRGCEEIPADVLRAAKMDPELLNEPSDSPTAWHCSLIAAEEKQLSFYGLLSDSTPKDHFTKLGYMIDPNPHGSLPNAYLHHMGGDAGYACIASLPTNRGRFAVSFEGGLEGKSQAEKCELALAALETIILELGGKNED